MPRVRLINKRQWACGSIEDFGGPVVTKQLTIRGGRPEEAAQRYATKLHGPAKGWGENAYSVAVNIAGGIWAIYHVRAKAFESYTCPESKLANLYTVVKEE